MLGDREKLSCEQRGQKQGLQSSTSSSVLVGPKLLGSYVLQLDEAPGLLPVFGGRLGGREACCLSSASS